MFVVFCRGGLGFRCGLQRNKHIDGLCRWAEAEFCLGAQNIQLSGAIRNMFAGKARANCRSKA